MPVHHRPANFLRPSLSFALLSILLIALWIAGGASRADAFGQVVVRGVAWAIIVALLLFAAPPRFGRAKPVLYLLLAAIALALLQLVPLPAGIWQALPGRALFVEAAAASGQPQPWRPWSIVPGATANAASSLVVPFAVLLCLAGLKPAERQGVPAALLGLIVAITMAGLLQLSGGGVNNPLVNETVGEVSGTFANRNHFALLLAIGCLVAPVWVFQGDRRPDWRGPVAFGLVLLFALTILATGSRAGLGLGGLGLVVGLVLVRHGIRRALRRQPRWVFPALIAGIIGVVGIFVLASVALDRAASVARVLAVDPAQDMRNRGMPTVLEMMRIYFPLGAGLGGFDQIFRIHEPFELLKPSYFNHAHNDWFEIVLDAGIPGVLVVLAGLIWWGWASFRAWRAGPDMRYALPKLGSTMLLFVFIASAFDYPARTPVIMAVIVIAATWLAGGLNDASASALPARDQQL